MAYAVCTRARILKKEHWRDNTLTGTLAIGADEYQFKTRGHISKAINSRYSDVAWKPGENDEILFDGEIFRDQAIIDHMEPWRPEDHTPLGRHEDLIERLGRSLPDIPEMSKLARQRLHDDEGVSVRCIRWMKDATARQGRKDIPVVLSAICAEGEIRFAARTKSGAKLVDNRTVAALPLIAQMLGIPVADFSTPEALPAPKPVSTKNPNKWVPGVPYRPEGMPERDPFTDEGNPFVGETYDDIPF